MTNTIGTSALKETQATTPAFSLVIVEKPAPVCPSALREPVVSFSQGGHVFELIHDSNECRVFQSTKNAVCYCMEVVTTISEDGKKVTTKSSINGRFVSEMNWLIHPYYAMRGFMYLENAGQATRGAFDHLQSLVLSGKA